MDLESQAAIKRLAEEFGRENLLVLLGAPDAESAEISAETVVEGDPTFAGPLAAAQLGLEVYHVLEEDIRNTIPEEVWEDQIGVMADVLDVEEIASAIQPFREKVRQ
jgi:hypothetical protein